VQGAGRPVARPRHRPGGPGLSRPETAGGPAVAVVVPTYQYGHFVGRAIDSALAQSHPPAEVVVVDDGSTDDTAGVVARYGPPVRLLSQDNRGVAAARNAGIAASASPLLAFLDADDTWEPGKLAAQVARWTAQPDLGLVHCGVSEVDVDGTATGTRLEGAEGRVAEDLLLLTGPGILGGGSGPLVPRSVIDRVGGFDERLSTSADWELWLRIAAEHPVGFVAEPLVRYTIHGGNMHRNLAAMEHDVLLGFEKAFAAHPATLGPRRQEALANLYMTLAGSHFAAGEVVPACRDVARSVRHRPAKLAYLLELPLRRLHRRRPAPGPVSR
jgi:glycosyltransferase involved in cell wall biosynthesis